MFKKKLFTYETHNCLENRKDANINQDPLFGSEKILKAFNVLDLQILDPCMIPSSANLLQANACNDM
jgi:hypothetical protein